MKKYLAFILSVFVVLSSFTGFSVFAENTSFYLTFDDEDDTSFSADNGFQPGGSYSEDNISISDEKDHTTGIGKSLKAERREALNDRIKIMNVFSEKDIGKKFDISLYVFVPNQSDAVILAGVYGAKGTDNTAKISSPKEMPAKKGEWTKIEFVYEHTDKLNTQIGIEQKSGEVADTIYIDDVKAEDMTPSDSKNDGENTGKDNEGKDDSSENINASEEYVPLIKKFKALSLAKTLTNNFDEKSTVTRGDFASAMADFIAKDFSLSSDEVMYSDVGKNDKNYAAICALSALNYMNGEGDGKFNPDEAISETDALTVMCKMMGFNIYAESRGGYPQGYISAARESKICENIPVSYSDSLTQGKFLKFLDNFTDAPILEQTQFGSSNKYTKTEGVTVLSENLDIYYDTLRVTGNSKTMLDTYSNLPVSRVMMGTKEYNKGETDTDKYLGYEVKFYYTNKDKTYPDILYSIPEEGSYREIVIDVSDKDVIKDSRLYYEDNEKLKNVKIEFDADVIYNGVYTSYDSSLINNMNDGYIKFLDYNNDGKYETIFINDIKYLVVDSVNTSLSYIYPKYGEDSFELDLDDITLSASLKNAAGQDLKLSDLKEWNVLSSYVPRNSDAKSYVVSDKTVSGVISSVKNDDNGIIDVITIDSVKYSVTETMKNLVKAGKMQPLSSGDDVILYLTDTDGVATMRYNNSKPSNIAYVYEAGFNDDSSKKLYLKLYCTDGTFNTYTFADRVKINDDSYKKFKEIDTTPFYNNDKTVNQVICYNLNSDGEISRIWINNPDEDMKEGRIAKIGADLKGYVKRGKINYFASPGNTSLSKVYSIADDVTVIKIPANENLKDDESYYGVMQGDLSTLPNAQITADIYTFKASHNLCDILLLKIDQSKIMSFDTAEPVLVTDITDEIDDNDEEFKRVTGIISTGEEVSFLYKDERPLTGNGTRYELTIGDIIGYQPDEFGIVRFTGEYGAKSSSNLSIGFFGDYNPKTKTYTHLTAFSASQMGTLCNTFAVHHIKDGYIYLNFASSPESEVTAQAYRYSDFKIYRFDKNRNKFYEASVDEATTYELNPQDYSRAFIHIKNRTPKIMVFY